MVTWEREFNYSAINNFGVTFAKGEYLLFLNNDTELIAENFIEEMLGLCQREDVGAVGARLLYQDDTIQHAGVVVGFGGIAGHTFIGLHKAENSYFHRAMSTQDYSAVTAACLMTKKALFDEVGGVHGHRICIQDFKPVGKSVLNITENIESYLVMRSHIVLRMTGLRLNTSLHKIILQTY